MGEQTSTVFEKLLEKVGTYQKIELEETEVDMQPTGSGGFITITHRVTGAEDAALVQQRLQFVGFKPHIVSIAKEKHFYFEPITHKDSIMPASQSSLTPTIKDSKMDLAHRLMLAALVIHLPV